jgi:hypothetical protein
MPLNNAQLGDLVNRARLKAPPSSVHHRPQLAVQRSKRPSQPTVASHAHVEVTAASGPPGSVSLQSVPEPIMPATPRSDDFPIGWELKKESWHFHRRFYAIFKRAMRHGEYSQLLCQIRRGAAEPLGGDCWRVTLPGSSRTLPVRATPPWRLITILPKNWQPMAEG